jgi:hypothetical protein
MRILHKTILLIIILTNLILAQSKLVEEQNNNTKENLSKVNSVFDRAVGFMDAGAMKITGVENFGLLSGWDPPGYQNWYPGAFHGDWGEVRWIAPVILMPPGPWGAQNTNGPALPEDRSSQYNAIESFSAIHLKQGDGVNFTDWEAADGSAEHLHGNFLKDNMHLVATSTYSDSWPEGYYDDNDKWVSTPGEHHWPGKWALDPDPSSPTYMQPMKGEFVSNKDIYFMSTDKYNGIRSAATTAKYGYPVGIDMEVSGYSYSTTLYQSVVFFNINFIYRTKEEITNPDSRYYDPDRHFYDGRIDSVYFAFFVDPDLPGRYLVPNSNFAQAHPWAEDDYGLIYDYDGDGSIDVFLAFDKKDDFTDETFPQNTGPVSAYGINFFKTPKQNPSDPLSKDIGITGFHWFDQDEAVRPALINEQWEKTLYAISAGNPKLVPVSDRDKWFHGNDPKVDDVELLKKYQEGFPVGSRPDIQFWFSSGPFSIAPGDTIPIHIGIVGGRPNPGALDPDGFPTNPPDVRFKSIFDALAQADTLYKNNFIGFRPPASPKLSAKGTLVKDKNGIPTVYGESGKVTLYWDDASEESYEIVTKEKDFQGYRIYRTQAAVNGQGEPEWGTPITDYSGKKIVGYVPLAQYDLIDEWKGPDPLNPFFDLGSNTGLKYTFVDNDVVDGIRYRYTITAYDHPVTDANQSALESSRGNDPRLVQTVDVIPGMQPQGFIGGKTDSTAQHISGLATGSIDIQIINDMNITGHTYKLEFKDSSDALSLDVLDEEKNEYVVENFKNFWNSKSGKGIEPRPIFDGIGLLIENHTTLEQNTQGWNSVTSDTSDYYFSELTYAMDSSGIPCDYMIVFGDSTAKYSGVATSFKVPFQVFNVTNDPNMNNPLNLFVKNPSLPWSSGEFVYLLEPDIKHRTWQFTITWGDTNTAPKAGDQYLYTTKKPFKQGDVYEITTKSLTVKTTDSDLNKIKVVPNPYLVYNLAEQATDRADQFTHELRFTHLPKECTIKIYTLRGDLVRTLYHNSYTIGEERWDLLTEENMEVSYGVYIYTVETPDGSHHIGKFAIVW